MKTSFKEFIKMIFCSHDFELCFKTKAYTTELGRDVYYIVQKCKKCPYINYGLYN